MAFPLPQDTFHPFPRLPKELRIEIWKQHLAALEPRLLRVWCKISTEPIDPKENPDGDHEIFIKGERHRPSPDPVPALPHTCQESRSKSLRHYTRAFIPAIRGRADPRYVWTSFAADTIKIKAGSLVRISKENRKRIQHMSIDTDCPICFYDCLITGFNLMENLKHLEILCPSPLWRWGDWAKRLMDGFREWFGDAVPGYVPPDVRFVQTRTWWEMDIRNYEDIMEYGRE
ncbi:hypothetical protein BKA61DRAFT_309286 [Leptodontidium sp. MPI-SDFR-AT-0119]|nr:hypothetical protein BKA61DRAFT_309286 [Leptodontidium sp. MPI-SDFR-AT-0119]